MKNKLKKLFRLGFTLFGILLLLTNCERDNLQEDTIQSENQEPTFTLKQYSRKNIEENTKLVSKLKEFNDKLIEKKSAKYSKKNADNKEFDFTIYTNSATYLQNGDYHSYTFPIVQGADEKIKNVFFELNDQDEYDAFLVKYDYSANELKFQDFSSLSMKTSMKPIDLDFDSLFKRTQAAYVCIYLYEPVGNNFYYDADEYENEWVLTASYCETVYSEVEDSTSYNYEQGTATVTISGTTYGGTGTGGSSTSPMPSPFDAEELMQINVVKSELNLNRSESSWLDEYENAQYAFQIYYFGIAQMWSQEAKDLGKEAINALMDDIPVVFNLDEENLFSGNPLDYTKLTNSQRVAAVIQAIKNAVENNIVQSFDLNEIFINLPSVDVNIVGKVLINGILLTIRVDFAVLENLVIDEYPNNIKQYQLMGIVDNYSMNGFWSVFKFRNFGVTGNVAEALYLYVKDLGQYDDTNRDLLEDYLGY